MISRTGASAAACALAVALLGVVVPSSAASPGASETAQAPVVEDVGVLPAVASTAGDEAASGTPDSTLVELPVVVPPVDGDVVEETPELLAARDEPDAIVAEEVVAERVSTEVVTTDEFQTIGVTWPEGADAAALEPQVRVMTDGEWSGWVELGQEDEAPDAGTADAENAVRDGTEAMWVGDAEAIQLSFAATADGGPDDLTLVLVGSEEVPLPADDRIVGEAEAEADGEMVVQTATMSAVPLADSAPALQIVTRAQWGARAQVCTPDVASRLVGAVVHHTAGSNTYSTQGEAMQQIRNDQRYHIEGRGWCDLGYNFVVDKWGNIYEGRADSLTKPVIGVHAGGFNTGTVGVSMLGTYGAPPPAATQRSVAQIIAFRLGPYGVRAQDSMSYYTGTGENSKYQNQTVILRRVFGHRDVAYTTCPGDGGYGALPAIRVMADQYSYGTRFQQAGAVVRAMYADILGRGVDPSGLQTWSGMLAAGSGGPALVQALTGSDEYVRLRITQAYTEVLGRAPEPAGMAYWYQRIRAGVATVDDVQRRFLSSSEFMARAGGTDEGYVRRMYTSVLGREAAEAEIQHWVVAIATQGRERVTDAIWFSTEAAQHRAGAYYRTFLKREPDAPGVRMWAQVLLRSGEGAVRIGIAGSEEYRVRALARYP